MFSYIWPIALVVLSNVVYQICAKSTPRIKAGILICMIGLYFINR